MSGSSQIGEGWTEVAVQVSKKKLDTLEIKSGYTIVPAPLGTEPTLVQTKYLRKQTWAYALTLVLIQITVFPRHLENYLINIIF